MVSAVDVDDAGLLPRLGGGVATQGGVAEADRLVNGDVFVEDVGAPFHAVFLHELLLRMFAADEAVQHAHTVGETRPAQTDHGGVKAVAHSTWW